MQIVQTTSSASASYPEVANFAALPSAAGASGLTYLVKAAQGVFFVNRKPAGLYSSNGSAWTLDGDATEAYFQDTLAWSNITSKPATFPPSAHVHDGADITTGTVNTARLGSGTANSTTFLRGDNTWQTPPGGGGATWGAITGTLSSQTDLNTALNGKASTAHASTHVTGGSDVIANVVAAGNSGLMTGADKTKLDGVSGSNTGDETTATIKSKLGITTLSGSNTGDQTISISGDVTAAGSTGVLSATVTKMNGVALSGLGTGIVKNTTGTGVPSIAVNTDLPVMTATQSGAVPTPPNNTTTFLRGDGTFATPPGGGGSVTITAATVTIPYGNPEAKATVTDASVTGSSKIMIQNGDYSDLNENDPTMDQYNVTVFSKAVGSFVVSVSSAVGQAIGGAFKINYILG